jgi:hypothetical protein
MLEAHPARAREAMQRAASFIGTPVGAHSGPTLACLEVRKPSQKRVAIHVEDHPLSSGAFEGTIPPKQYGAGTVIVWDNGTWVPVGDPHEGMKNGKLLFQFARSKAEYDVVTALPDSVIAKPIGRALAPSRIFFLGSGMGHIASEILIVSSYSPTAIGRAIPIWFSTAAYRSCSTCGASMETTSA